MLDDPWFYAAAIPAVTLFGLAKGGFAGIGALGVPFLALVVSPLQAAAILLPILLVQDIVSVRAFYRKRDDGLLVQMLPGAAVGIGLGYGLAAYVPVAATQLVVGALSMGFGIQRLRIGPGAAAVVPRRWAGGLMGAAAGFTSQIAHAGGPPFQMHVLPLGLTRDRFMGTSAIFFAAVNCMKVPAYAALGQFSPANLLAAAALMPVAIASTWAGVWLVRRVDAARFFRIIYVLMVLVGGKLVWDGISGLIQEPF